MVIDTAYWNSLKLREKCFECAEIQKNSGGTYYDYYAQGALNYAIAKKIQKIPFKFNFTQLGWNPHIPTNHIAKACILHWSGPRKPWNENGLYKDWYQTA
jgi:lipopolysaccharide biosynthesis glycosyltransferase